MKPVHQYLLSYCILLLVLSTVFTTASQAQDLVKDYQQFMTAYNDKQYALCVQKGEPLAKITDHPGIQYKLAECACQTGQRAQSLELLGNLAGRGLSYEVEENKGLSPLYGDQRFQQYAAAFRKNRAVLDKSSVSFVIHDSLLIPEGIAVDPRGHTFFVGSLARHKVISCDAKGHCTDFVDGKKQGCWMVLGMKVSADGKSLWLCSAAEHDTLNGYAGVFQFDIPSGKLIKKWVVDNKKEPHLFNDLILTQGGDVYFTDSKAGKLWRIGRGSDTLTEYAAGLVYPNGIAWDEEKKALFVADFTGLYLFDLSTDKRVKLDHQGRTYLNGIDGLYYYKGALLAIQDSGNQDDRIVKFNYDVKQGAITRTQTLQSFRKDFIIPTTGTLANGELHYIANAQLRSLQPDGTLTNPEKLVKPVILKLKVE